MDLKRLSDKAKELVDKRGGTDSLKQDADELKRIAQGEGSLTDKAKAAAASLKDPGADEAEEPAVEGEPAKKSRGRGQGKRRGGGGRGGGRGRNRL